MDEDETYTLQPGEGALVPATVTVGTPLKLAPPTAAFRASHAGGRVAPAPTIPVGGFEPVGDSKAAAQSPNKGVLGQMSDLIFGW
jgi:nuclear pore complex protein Nup53